MIFVVFFFFIFFLLVTSTYRQEKELVKSEGPEEVCVGFRYLAYLVVSHSVHGHQNARRSVEIGIWSRAALCVSVESTAGGLRMEGRKWTKMVQSLRTWPYLETATLALAVSLFLHILDDKLYHGRLMLVFWTGIWCGSAPVVLLIYLHTLSVRIHNLLLKDGRRV